MIAVPDAVHPDQPPAAQAQWRRRDAWWVEPLIVVIVLGSFGAYSPCLAANCAHVSLPLVGSWWNLSPAFLILGIPLGFRATCYYYRKAYYRSFFWSPPACSIPDASRHYSGETRFPFLLQNLHRYFFYLSVVVVLFLWWDALMAFKFPTGFGIGLGTLILIANATLLSLYTLSCHSCRHLCGGYLDTFRQAPTRFRLWHTLSRLNERHPLFAWISLFGVALTDVYVRLLAMGVIQDPRFVF